MLCIVYRIVYLVIVVYCVLMVVRLFCVHLVCKQHGTISTVPELTHYNVLLVKTILKSLKDKKGLLIEFIQSNNFHIYSNF